MYKKLSCFLFISFIIIFSCYFLLWGSNTLSGVDKSKKVEVKEMSLYITGMDKYEDLERPPVYFAHDKHTKALKDEGCGDCHPENKKKKGRFILTSLKGINTKSKSALMDSYHKLCIGCHEKRAGEGKTYGGNACGDCHVQRKFHKVERAGIDKDYYNSMLADPYHKDCVSCHKDEQKQPKEAEGLDWKGFYIKTTEIKKANLPKPFFGYYLHNKHDKKMEEKCENCHHIYDKKAKKVIYKKHTESSCRDCHKTEDTIVDKELVRSNRKAMHGDCINCHMIRLGKNEDAGPVKCGECHRSWEKKSIAEIAKVPRPDRKQKKNYLITVKDARMKKVLFNHKLHEQNTLSCRSCHHDTLAACRNCHTVKGDEKKGKGITLAEAYHSTTSTWSCVGCHESAKAEDKCAGCHNSIKGGLTDSSCLVCHSGATRTKGIIGKPASLFPSDLKKELKINVLEKDYKETIFPHLKIANKLTEISNKSELAKVFHRDKATMCNGCHHYSPIQTGKKTPLCSTCHTKKRKQSVEDKPSLLGAYHRQCLGCHNEMKIKTEKPGCEGCHEKKKKEKQAVKK